MVHFLVALALCYVLIKIPFWVLNSIRSSGRRSFVGSLIRGFIAYKTFGLLRGLGSGRKTAKPRGGQKFAAEPDSYAKTRATSSGQYMLPLNVKRVPKPPNQRQAPRPRPRPSTGQGKQLTFPLDGEWPENKPRLGRDGQYRLPLDVQRQPKPTSPTQPTPSPRPSARPQGQQLKLPADGQWPENRPRLGRDGQYRLPIQVKRVRRPAASATPTPRPSSPMSRQLKLPADGEWPENKPRLGSDGQYRLPLTLQRTRKPAPPPDPQPPKQPTRGRQQALPLDLPKVHPPRPSTGRGT